ncbi:hypothetical protein D2V93_05815 [Flagellimonas taeanensis]|uniref:hypothetical protein n=1 Tax=Flavobacteriaceae TaxID=49546 RepID=UPI000E681F51|nr:MULTISPECIES: hypothetical protein [Allomuricauda]MDC6384481.1 hypothetical protein [Muricauda sp. SK9]RIV52163.1 hypothetical protein D2V93_05815 [Allomuricauda taeanensis]
MGKVALVEFNSYHDECLYSQIKFLTDSGHTVTLVISEQIHERASEYVRLAEEVIIFQRSSQKNLFKRIAFTLGLSRFFRKKMMETLIFNTASSRLEVILLSHLLKRKTKLFGILHNLKKVNHSFSQKLINKAIKKFFVLNDFLLDSVKLEDSSLKLGAFYPIFFPAYDSTAPAKPKEETWISIPGKLDFGRRDYFLVAKALEKTQAKSNLKILILGSTNVNDPKSQEFLDHIKTHDLQDNFITFDAFLDNDTFHDYIKKSDYILIPLDSVGDNYAKYKIMGCYNQAFGYKKTLISPIGLEHIPDMESHSIFFNGADGLSEIFAKMSNGKSDKKEYVSKKWDFAEQKNSYITFLESN